MSYGWGEAKYSFVKVKVLKLSVPTFWYRELVGKTIEVRKCVIAESISYEYLLKHDPLMPNATYHLSKNDVEEIK